MQNLINEVLKKNRLPIAPEKLMPIFEKQLEAEGDFTRTQMNQVAGLAADSELVATKALKMREDHFRMQGKKPPAWPKLAEDEEKLA